MDSLRKRYRTAIWILVGLLAVAVLGSAIPNFVIDIFFPELGRFNLVDWVVRAVLDWPGPFEVLTGNWMLIDV